MKRGRLGRLPTAKPPASTLPMESEGIWWPGIHSYLQALSPPLRRRASSQHRSCAAPFPSHLEQPRPCGRTGRFVRTHQLYKKQECARGEHAHSRIAFKQLLQADLVDVVQINSCRLAGVSEVLTVMLMAKKFSKSVCPHAGDIGLCEYVMYLSMIDYVLVTADMKRNVLEWVSHLHECLCYRVKVDSHGR